MKRVLAALVAPFVIFGLLHVLAVQPRQAAAQDALARMRDLRAQLARARGAVRGAPDVVQDFSTQEFEIRTPNEDRSAEVAEALTNLANGPGVGGVRSLAIETEPVGDGPVDPRMDLFGQPVAYAPVTVAFDAHFEQIGRFFWNLRSLPSMFELRSLEMAPVGGGDPLMRAKVVLFVFQRVPPVQVQPGPALIAEPQILDVTTPPEWHHDPFALAPEVQKVAEVAPPPPADPVVQSILFSGPRRVALVDGRVVREGDRLGSAIVRTVEAETVVIVALDGTERRLVLDRPEIKMVRR